MEMSRRSQDIPIRPRYGIPDITDDNNYSPKERPKHRTRKTPPSAMEPSSYSEIPFLAQYPDMDISSQDIQQTNTEGVKTERTIIGEPGVEYDDEDDNSNSKDSSYEDNKTPKRPNSLHCDSCKTNKNPNIDFSKQHYLL